MGTVAVFGGTFNPLHIGHIEIISELASKREIERIVLIPTKIPPHKVVDRLADEEDRINMCNMVAKRFEKVEVSDLELKRQGKSYTIDTIDDIKRLYPESNIAITIGADMVVTFTEWKNYRDIIKKAKIFAFGRQSVSEKAFEDGVEFLKSIGADIEVISATISDISSTQIRNAIFEKSDISRLLDKDIYEYIIKNNLYGV